MMFLQPLCCLLQSFRHIYSVGWLESHKLGPHMRDEGDIVLYGSPFELLIQRECITFREIKISNNKCKQTEHIDFLQNTWCKQTEHLEFLQNKNRREIIKLFFRSFTLVSFH